MVGLCAMVVSSVLLVPASASGVTWRAQGKNIEATLDTASAKPSVVITVRNQKVGAKVTMQLHVGSCKAKGKAILSLVGQVAPDKSTSKGTGLTSSQVRALGTSPSLTVGSTCLDFIVVHDVPITTADGTKQVNETHDSLSGSPAVQANLPVCPKDLSGLLTAPIIDPNYLVALVPLGNIAPPGHTSPVDHTYFQTNKLETTTMNAPADAVITAANSIENLEADGKYYLESWVITYAICKGVAIDITGFLGMNPAVEKAITAAEGKCAIGPQKPDHKELGNRFCLYEVQVPVKSGQVVGWTKATLEVDGNTSLPVEAWATNQNAAPRSDVQWNYYLGYDKYYPYATCLFDLYSGALKDAYYAKFGTYERSQNHTGPFQFYPRTLAPKCGTIVQDLTGTVQGMWFNGPADGTNYEFVGRGLAFLHYNIDPTMAEISIGGTVVPDSIVQMFAPQHAGLINREPSEVKSDGNVYCYTLDAGPDASHGKLLVQLTDDRHITLEHQLGACTATEHFATPLQYQR